jgi:hypothetical protein
LLYAISQSFNDKNPFHCFPSIDYLATVTGRAPSSVWAMLPQLAKLGVIEIEWGSKGSGHPNVYRLPAAFLEFYFGPEKGRQPKRVPVPRKPRQTGVSKYRQTGIPAAPKTPTHGAENPDARCIKPRRVGVNHLIATSIHKSAPPARSSARVERGEETSVTDDRRDRANGALYRALLQAYPEYLGNSSDSECRETFFHLLDTGHDHDKIIDGALDYGDRCRGTDPKNVKPLIYYLRVKGWEQQNHHLLQAVH